MKTPPLTMKKKLDKIFFLCSVFVTATSVVGCSGSSPSSGASGGEPTVPTDVLQAPAPDANEHRIDSAPPVGDLPQPQVLARVTAVDRTSFGGAHPGLAHWLSSNGRLVLLRRFLHDNDGDGQVSPTFGHHGAPIGDQPTLALFDLSSGTDEVFDEITATDPQGRFLVLRKEDHLWLLDASDGSRTDLSALGADPRGDQNPCLPPRQASFDHLGRTVSWLRTNPPGFVVRRLDDGHEVVVSHPPSSGVLWRVEPQALPGWALTYEIPSDTDGDGRIAFPRQQTSCACRWCSRFALSMSFGGWAGDSFHIVLVGPDNARIPVDDSAIPLSENAYARRMGRDQFTLHSRDGGDIDIPEDCQAVVVAGSESVLLRCIDESRLLWPSETRQIELAIPVETNSFVRPSVDDDGQLWIPVVARQGGRRQLGRLCMDNGRLEVGPDISSLPSFSVYDIATALSGDGVVAIDVSRGDLYEVDVAEDVELQGATIALPGPRYMVLAPSEGRWFDVSFQSFMTTRDGCTLVPTTEQAGLETGPWHLRCATP